MRSNLTHHFPPWNWNKTYFSTRHNCYTIRDNWWNHIQKYSTSFDAGSSISNWSHIFTNKVAISHPYTNFWNGESGTITETSDSRDIICRLPLILKTKIRIRKVIQFDVGIMIFSNICQTLWNFSTIDRGMVYWLIDEYSDDHISSGFLNGVMGE